MIKVLPPETINQIAAGEVVERPASVLKELIENSIDAGSTDIKVYIKDFGTKKIQVIDNGSGIIKEDLDKVFLKHATSKITQIEDLDKLISFGFRGEALASISSVSRVVLQTKHVKDQVGSEVIFESGKIKSIKPSAIPFGADIQILDLFENVPARKKFLKSSSTENKTIMDLFYKFVLANPQINFSIDLDGVTKDFKSDSHLKRISKVLKTKEEDLIEVKYDGTTKVHGFVMHPRNFLKNKSNQFIFVNNRPVSDATIYKAIVDGFDTFLMKNQYPGFVVFVNVSPDQVDVNVHPRKTEVRFGNPSEIYKSVRTAVNVNLVNNLRKETLNKLRLEEDSQIKEQIEIKYTNSTNPQSNLIKEDSVNYSSDTNKNLAKEFENFLYSTPNKTENSLSDNNSKEIENKFKYETKDALLFSKEVLKNEQTSIFEEDNKANNLFLDLANATQLLNSYILTSNGNNILIIDQHAASERYFYEKYLKQLKSKKVESKVLLFAEIVTLDSLDLRIIEEHKQLFNDLGFDFETFGGEELKFNQVPSFIRLDNFSKVIDRIIEDIKENNELTNVKDKIYHEIAATLACHTAVRFGDKLTKEEIIQILKNLTTCEDPYNCPHGRPVIQDLSKYDIEKKFKRCGI